VILRLVSIELKNIKGFKMKITFVANRVVYAIGKLVIPDGNGYKVNENELNRTSNINRLYVEREFPQLDLRELNVFQVKLMSFIPLRIWDKETVDAWINIVQNNWEEVLSMCIAVWNSDFVKENEDIRPLTVEEFCFLLEI
jgi:hypothetical protein